MKKICLFFSLFVCCMFASQASADWSNQGDCCNPCGQQAEAAAPCEQQMNDCYCLYCKYVPQYYDQWHCDYVPQYTQKKCCRMVPQCYEKTCCRYVPQYYTQTCTRQVPEYYYTQDCHYVPKYSCEKCCRYVPQYYYKHTCGNDAGACAAPCQDNSGCR